MGSIWFLSGSRFKETEIVLCSLVMPKQEAIRLSEERRPILDGKKCVGCHLCVLVCPERAIISSRKRIIKKA